MPNEKVRTLFGKPKEGGDDTTPASRWEFPQSFMSRCIAEDPDTMAGAKCIAMAVLTEDGVKLFTSGEDSYEGDTDTMVVGILEVAKQLAVDYAFSFGENEDE